MRPIAAIAALALAVTLAGCAPATLDDSEMPVIMQLREQQLREMGGYVGVPADTPIPELVRWVTDHEAPPLIATCLQEAGFDVELLAGMISFDNVPEDQGSAAQIAQWKCQAQYSTDPRGQLPLTDAQFRMLYDYDTTTMRDCLDSHGIFVDTAPNFEIWLEDLRNGEGWSAWSYVDLSEVGPVVWNELEEDCPPDVKPEGFYGPALPQP